MNNKRILIVDDDEGVRNILNRIFTVLKSDYQVITVPDGFTTLKQFQQHSFDMVMTDYEMPGMNGLELANIVRQISPGTRIVLMTGSGYLLPNHRDELGVDGYIEKPFTPVQILDMVDHVMEK